jgi:hypothetical protein
MKDERIIQSFFRKSFTELEWNKAKEICEKIANYLQTKIPISFERTSRKIGGPDRWEIFFINKKSHLRNSYSVSVRLDIPEEIDLDFYEETEVSSESLADPTKNWETTTTRRVKLKKRKLRKIVENENKAKLVIDKFFKNEQ